MHDINTIKGINVNLSPREKQILQLLAIGNSQIQVAEKIFVSPHTVNFHVRNILGKLTAANITAAVAFAINDNLIALNHGQ